MQSLVAESQAPPHHSAVSAKEWARRGLVHPNCTFRRCWDLLTTYFVLYTAVFLPFRLAFDVPATGAWVVKDAFMDVLFIADFFLNFVTGFENGKGEIVMTHPEIARAYLQGWATLDLVASFPFDWVVGGGDPTDQTAARSAKLARFSRIMKVMRLMRLMRAARMGRLMKKLELVLTLKYGLLAALKFFAVVLLVAHWIACFCFLIPQLQDFPSDSWVQAYPAEGTPVVDLPVKTQYSICFYWAVTVMSTVGFGDITPGNNAERIYTLFCMLVGAVIFAYGITQLIDVVANLNMRNVTYRQLSDEVAEFLDFKQVPRELSMAAKSYLLQQKLATAGFFFDKGILDYLSPVLRDEVQRLVITNKLQLATLIRKRSYADEIMRILAHECDDRMYFVGDVVASPGRVLHESYFVLDGGLSETFCGLELCAYAPGDSVGEFFALKGTPVRSTITCTAITEMAVVPRRAWLAVLDEFPMLRVDLLHNSWPQRHKLSVMLTVSRAYLRSWRRNAGGPGAAAGEPGEGEGEAAMLREQIRVAVIRQHALQAEREALAAQVRPEVAALREALRV